MQHELDSVGKVRTKHEIFNCFQSGLNSLVQLIKSKCGFAFPSLCFNADFLGGVVGLLELVCFCGINLSL